ncbi:hypothetical protein MMC24_006810 [Lignoscripta atroalba]|nr:hypothetical protein [Lignoscripta atroalba]
MVGLRADLNSIEAELLLVPGRCNDAGTFDSMHKTLLLCFIHGFKGDNYTFGGFPEHLRALVSHALPKTSVKAVTYPQFETRGDLKECVGRFREWLQNVVIDLEVSAGTPSPTVDPSVHTILIGHSMGGIVAADTLLSITSDPPLPPPSSTNNNTTTTCSSTTSTSPPPSPHLFMFPYIQGILAFDTPYLGIAPSVVAHGAETHYKTASTAYSALSEVAGVFGWGTGTGTTSPPLNQQPRPAPSNQQPKLLLPPGPESAKDLLSASGSPNQQDAASAPAWHRWSKYAMFAGAAGFVAAGGAAAYVKRDSITIGWSWVGSHLEFVGCLMRAEELKARLKGLMALRREKGIGFADLVTVLGKGASGGAQVDNNNEKRGRSVAGGWVEIGGEEGGGLPARRMFCNVPATTTRKGEEEQEEQQACFEGMVNDKAKDETEAHMSMFFPRENPGYYFMSERAKELVVGWVDEGWYVGSEQRRNDAHGEDEHGKMGGLEGAGRAEREKEKKTEKEWDAEDMEASLGGEDPVLVD